MSRWHLILQVIQSLSLRPCHSPFDAYIGARVSLRQAEWPLLDGLAGAGCPGRSLKTVASQVPDSPWPQEAPL